MSHVFKCKMCGGVLEVQPGMTICECQYCGAVQTLPRLDSERKANLYDRADHFRRNNDYDKAMGIYELILNEDTTDAEAYWSLVLCKYGIEYVEDPQTHKRIPTVNRTHFTSIFADDDYKSALKYADDYQRQVYEQEAKVIDGIQKGILEISNKEEPFDIFICYKETDDKGERTQDSVLGYELYKALTDEGYKVFFSRITLEDKLGEAYEPYIFAALNSAKVLIALGTKPEYFNAPWVKNEWGRYLPLVQNSNGKKHLIPAYMNMDPYDLPAEFSHLQAQDLSKVGAMQDLLHGIQRLLGQKEQREKDILLDQLIEKQRQEIEEKQKQAEAKARAEEELKKKKEEAVRFQKEKAEKVKGAVQRNRKSIVLVCALIMASIIGLFTYNHVIKPSNTYKSAVATYESGDYKASAEMFENLGSYRDSTTMMVLSKYAYCQTLIQSGNNNEALEVYSEVLTKLSADSSLDMDRILQAKYDVAITEMEHGFYDDAINILTELEDYKDAPDRILEATYLKAKHSFENKDFDDAISLFESLGDYEDSPEMIKQTKYMKAVSYFEAEDYLKAIEVFSELEDYSDVKDKILEAKYQYVITHIVDNTDKMQEFNSELVTQNYKDINDYQTIINYRQAIIGSWADGYGIIHYRFYSDGKINEYGDKEHYLHNSPIGSPLKYTFDPETMSFTVYDTSWGTVHNVRLSGNTLVLTLKEKTKWDATDMTSGTYTRVNY